MFRKITLEVSLKPFKQTTPEYVRSVCEKIFDQWKPLLLDRSIISIMLWTADGSEILDYTGDPDVPFEWCYWLGSANLPDTSPDTPTEISLHNFRRKYMEKPPVMTYSILRNIVDSLREEGKRRFPDAEIRIGETFDIGPEFAISDFKYHRHPEVCEGSSYIDNHLGFVDATAALHADNYPYAAYPNGVPEGTAFGTLLGKQADMFLRDMGFDFLWLSNGLGFSADPWIKTGKIFDGKNYYPEKLKIQKEKVLRFWKLFREECSIPLEVRGTNNSVGIDYSTDGVPLYDIYNANFGITAPPNSPWAAINGDYGLELMGHMSRICELPSKDFPFRFYLHDPWWLNSPWYDRYNGVPCDIYLPMAISRISADGQVECANSLNLLTIDNSFGDMPDACVNEPLPHFLKAEKDYPDEPSPLVWIYPLKEYTTSENAAELNEMNLGDHYIRDAISDGLPLCSVTSTDSFLRHSIELYKKSTLISPVPQRKAVLEKLLYFANQGVSIMIYGTENMLNTVPEAKGVVKLRVEESAARAREAMESFGYKIRFEKKCSCQSPIITLHRNKSGYSVNVYNDNTTTKTALQFPEGAPILDCGETELENGFATYRFSRGEHKECRVFVEQDSGVISLREKNPTNARYRRKLLLGGLEHATVRFFPETDCEGAVAESKLYNADGSPRFDSRFTVVHDEKMGVHLLGRDVCGSVYLLIGHKKS